MASGRPVVMYRLQGIPDEYFEFCFTPGNNDSDGLRQCLLDVLSLRDDELSQIGFKAREFIYNNKSAQYQAEKMLNFRSEEHTSVLKSLMRISYAVFSLIKEL